MLVPVSFFRAGLQRQQSLVLSSNFRPRPTIETVVALGSHQVNKGRSQLHQSINTRFEPGHIQHFKSRSYSPHQRLLAPPSISKDLDQDVFDKGQLTATRQGLSIINQTEAAAKGRTTTARTNATWSALQLQTIEHVVRQ